MRILHSSDWHLGISNGAASRGPDHDRFLAWLLGQLSGLEVDALIIAGDVFDSMQPSSSALSRYYRFLGAVGATGVRQVVVVGGNHDSASRLDAPAEVLAALDVHVVGGIGATASSWERCLVPLKGRDGRVRAVALAVPYVHEFRLGVRTTDLDHAAVRAAFAERFGALYRHLADAAQARWPGLPLVATGHLTVGPAQRQDFPHEIHCVGQLEGLPPTVLDPRLQYAALGHIHRPYPVVPGRAWYSGSPVALALPEAAVPRRVLCVDLHDDPSGQPTVTPVEVPGFRALLELEAPPEALLERVRSLRWSEPLPPLLYLRALSDEPQPLLVNRLHEALLAFPEGERPALVELRELRATPLPEAQDPPPPSLRDLGPAQVFATLCRARGLGEAPELAAAFASLESASRDDFEAMIAQALGGEA
jgi:exonuclease SbcD